MKTQSVMVYAVRAAAVAFCISAAAMVLVYAAADRVYADTASTTTSTDTNIDLRNIFDNVLRRTIDTAGSASGGTSSASSSLRVYAPNIVDSINNLLSQNSSASTSTSTPGTGGSGGLGSSIVDMVNGILGTSTSGGMGATIADSITGGANGFGTSDFGPYIKCVLIASIGSPLPTYSTECNATTTNRARVTIIKNTVNADGMFEFNISGAGNLSASITTSGNTGMLQFLAVPGTFTISEMAKAGWTQTERGCVIVNATSTGAASGDLGWSVMLQAGDDIVCTFVNTTSVGGGGCTENCSPGGGGGCVSNCGGGSSGSSGGGGGGGGNGPILGGGGFSPGEVLGNAISNPEIPGIPNTGAGGNAGGTIMTLVSALIVMLGGLVLLQRRL